MRRPRSVADQMRTTSHPSSTSHWTAITVLMVEPIPSSSPAARTSRARNLDRRSRHQTAPSANGFMKISRLHPSPAMLGSLLHRANSPAAKKAAPRPASRRTMTSTSPIDTSDAATASQRNTSGSFPKTAITTANRPKTPGG